MCDDVKTEKFSVAPDAYFAWASIVASLALLSFVAYFFSALVSILLAVIGVVVYVIQFIASKHFFDPLYKVKTSQNVTAVKIRAERYATDYFCCSYRRYKRVDTSL